MHHLRLAIVVNFRLFSGAEIKKLVAIQAIFASVINGSENVPKRIRKKFEDSLKSLWSNEEKVSNYAKIYKLLDPTLSNLALGSVLLGQKGNDHCSLFRIFSS